MNIKDSIFRGRIEQILWQLVVDYALPSLDCNKDRYCVIWKGTYVKPYIHKEGFPLLICNGSCGIGVDVGSRRDLEDLEEEDLEKAIDHLTSLEERGYRNCQKLFAEIIEGQRVGTSRYVLSRSLSRDPVRAVIELKEVCDDYQNFRREHLNNS